MVVVNEVQRQSAECAIILLANVSSSATQEYLTLTVGRLEVSVIFFTLILEDIISCLLPFKCKNSACIGNNHTLNTN